MGPEWSNETKIQNAAKMTFTDYSPYLVSCNPFATLAQPCSCFNYQDKRPPESFTVPDTPSQWSATCHQPITLNNSQYLLCISQSEQSNPAALICTSWLWPEPEWDIPPPFRCRTAGSRQQVDFYWGPQCPDRQPPGFIRLLLQICLLFSRFSLTVAIHFKAP